MLWHESSWNKTADSKNFVFFFVLTISRFILSRLDLIHSLCANNCFIENFFSSPSGYWTGRVQRKATWRFKEEWKTWVFTLRHSKEVLGLTSKQVTRKQKRSEKPRFSIFEKALFHELMSSKKNKKKKLWEVKLHKLFFWRGFLPEVVKLKKKHLFFFLD